MAERAPMAMRRDPRTQLPPGVVALPVGEPRMKHRDAVAEMRAEAGHGLGRERDLRHEHDGRPGARVDDLLQELDVDQRLAGGGDAVKQDGPRRRSVQRGHEPRERVRLGGIGRQVGRRLQTSGGERVTHDLLVADLDDALLFQSLHYAPADALVEERGKRHRSGGALQRLVGGLLARRAREGVVPLGERLQPARDVRDFPGARHRPRPPARPTEHRGKRRAQDEPQRSDVVRGHPAGELEEPRRSDGSSSRILEMRRRRSLPEPGRPGPTTHPTRFALWKGTSTRVPGAGRAPSGTKA